jgi:branched-chain amino acid transport system substrate-binding protein
MRYFGLLFAVVGVTLVGAKTAAAETLVGLAGPLTGPYAWAGASTKEAIEVAVADLNARGGVLGQPIAVIEADDYCDGAQAVAFVNKLVAARVVVVFGHQCSGAAIPASKVYADAGVLLIATGATSPKLTEQGFTNVFRMVGRDDLQGRVAGDLLADRWSGKPIAILHDGQPYGQGLAEETRQRLKERGVAEAMFESIEPGKADYSQIVNKMRASGIRVLYYGGYTHEAALIIRAAKEHGYKLQLVAGDGISNEDFGLIAGAASDGTLMTNAPVPSGPEAAEFATKFREGMRLRFAATAPCRSGRKRSRRRARSRSKPLRRCCAATNSIPCSAGSASTRKATSRAMPALSGTSGKMAPTNRLNRPTWPIDLVAKGPKELAMRHFSIPCARFSPLRSSVLHPPLPKPWSVWRRR